LINVPINKLSALINADKCLSALINAGALINVPIDKCNSIDKCPKGQQKGGHIGFEGSEKYFTRHVCWSVF